MDRAIGMVPISMALYHTVLPKHTNLRNNLRHFQYSATFRYYVYLVDATF